MLSSLVWRCSGGLSNKKDAYGGQSPVVDASLQARLEAIYAAIEDDVSDFAVSFVHARRTERRP